MTLRAHKVELIESPHPRGSGVASVTVPNRVKLDGREMLLAKHGFDAGGGALEVTTATLKVIVSDLSIRPEHRREQVWRWLTGRLRRVRGRFVRWAKPRLREARIVVMQKLRNH